MAKLPDPVVLSNRTPKADRLRAQIRSFLMQRLLNGEWQAGDRVPAESELVTMFGSSRMTVHAVLRELQSLGYLVRGKGKGSFVAEPRNHHSVIAIPDPADEIVARGQHYTRRILVRQSIDAPANKARLLGMEGDAQLDRVVVLHSGSGKPSILEDRLVNPAMMPGFLALDFDAASPFVHLMRRYPFPDSRHVIRAVSVNGQDAQWLELPTGAPCLELCRTTIVGGTPVTHVRFLYAGEEAAISGSVERSV